MIRGHERESIFEVIQRLKGIPLKPMQKLELLTTYLIPRILYGLIVSSPSQMMLRQIDVVIREEVKKMLHVTEKTSTPFMYVPRSLGGLGLPKLETMVQIATLRNAVRALRTTDPWFKT